MIRPKKTSQRRSFIF